jgi:hypothetical protein
VVTPQVARGFDPAFPFRVAGDPDAWRRALCALLDDEAARCRLGEAAREHVARHYTAGAWRDRAAQLLGSDL